LIDCTPTQLNFLGFKRHKIQASFSGGHVSSDAGGCLLLQQVDRCLGLLRQVGKALNDPRRKASCEHSLLSMLRQRVYGLALGYEDLNDHDQLRKDWALQTVIERDTELASSTILCRLENRKVDSFMVTMIPIASYPCTYFAANSYWSVTFARVRLMELNTLGLFFPYWSNNYAKLGPR